MTLTEQINQDIKTAMKARDKEKLEALRAIKSALLLEATKGTATDLSEADGIKLLQRLHKQRMDAFEIYQQQGREDLAVDEKKQAEVITLYLPVQLTTEELEPEIRAIIDKIGAAGMKDMGKIMGIASKQFGGKAAGKTIAETVKRVLMN